MSTQVSLVAVQDAIQRAQRLILRDQRTDGSWDCSSELGPICTSQVLIALRYVGTLTEADAREMSRWLRSQQRADGSFVLHPFAKKGDLSATATAWAALVNAQQPENEQAIQRAKVFIDRNGGLESILGLLQEGALAPFFVALAGLLDPEKLPKPPMLQSLFPRLMSHLETKFNGGIITFALQLGAIVRMLRGDWGPNNDRKGFLGSREAAYTLGLMERFQNPNGSWNNEPMQVSLALPALVALGVRPGHQMFDRALRWLEGEKIRDTNGLHYRVFTASVWTTGFDARALLYSGVPAGSEAIIKACQWITSVQHKHPQDEMCNPNQPRTGGWGFQGDNYALADCDDAAVVMSPMALALQSGELPDSVAGEVRRSYEKGRDWLFAMQNPDGGWSAFMYGLPGKKPGPAMTEPIGMPIGEPLEIAKMFVWPPVELGDPSTEDLTARVLHCLGLMGYTTKAPEVRRAVEFLRHQQCENGAFWGRWVVSYLSSTSFVLMGLKEIQYDLQAPFVQKAIRWVLSCQNPDGGFGERPEACADPSQAGKGHSTPPLTGLVLSALVDVGLGKSEAAARAASYLLTQQRQDGSWLNAGYLHSYLMPNMFYYYPEAPRFYALEALGKYLSQFEPQPTPEPRYPDGLLDEARTHADAEADAVVAQIFAEGQIDSVNALLAAFFRNDDRIPAGLPPLARAYFDKYDKLPEWADADQLARAQQLFVKYGWEIAMALFCSSLPQAYAAKKGAHVLMQTHGMSDTRLTQRIFETAQFIFDVMDPHAYGEAGRGIPAALKVRLLHASVRHLLRNPRPGQPVWDEAFFGAPINQEDMAGTLMTFSCITFDALRRMELPVSTADAEAWTHAWNVVGHFLGVEERLRPRSFAEGEQLMDAIRRRQWASSEDGHTLVMALIKMIQSYWPEVMDGLPIALIRYLAGNHCADILDIPRVDWTHILVQAGTRFDQILRGVGPRSRFAELFRRASHLLMKGVVTAKRDGKDAQFRIPDSLKDTVNPDF